jgi:lipopolysaccharide transport system ATP-binding protein
MSTVIKIENLYKEYRLGVIGSGTLYRDLQSWWATVRGLEDPNSIIGHKLNRNAKDHILVLNDINLDVMDGEVLGIIGANGAGKSTLLKILSKVTSPTRGTIKYKGRIASLLEVGTGFHPELTGRENVYLNGAINGMNRQEVNRKLDEIVEFAGVEQFLDTPVKRYSSGMYVRLGFAVAAHLDPDILVVDEVLAVGDATFQKKAIGKMQEVSSMQGRTVLFVSHNMASVENLCQRAVLIDKGVIAYMGTPRETIDFYLDRNEVENKTSYAQIAGSEEKDKTLKAIRLVDDKNEQTRFFRVGEKVVFELFLDSGQVVLDSPRIVVSISNRKHGLICNFTTDQMVDNPFKVEGKTVIQCVWDECYLIPGTYFVSLKINAARTERADSVLQFEMIEKDIYGTGKEVSGNPKTVLMPKGHWHVDAH